MTNSQSTSLAKLRDENGFYSMDKVKAWAKKFKLPIIEKATSPKGDHVAIFRRSYNPSFQVFISVGNEIKEITAV